MEIARYEAATNQVQQARAALKQARDDLSKTTIYAPMSGTISDLNKEQGEIAVGSQFQPDIILVLADLSEMEARINVDENDIVSIADRPGGGDRGRRAARPGAQGRGERDREQRQRLRRRVDGPEDRVRDQDRHPGPAGDAAPRHDGRGRRLHQDQRERAQRAHPERRGADRRPARDRRARAAIAAETRYTADKDGFVEIVFCLEAGKAVARQVKTGIQSDELIEILDGLDEGDEVVTGSYRAISKDLVNGAVVTIDNEAKPEPAEATSASR